jgi:hypothetical protein
MAPAGAHDEAQPSVKRQCTREAGLSRAGQGGSSSSAAGPSDSQETGRKRGREELGDDEEEALARMRDPSTWCEEVGEIARKRYYSDSTGEELNSEKVFEGMLREITNMRSFGVFKPISLEQAKHDKYTIVPSRWVLVHKPRPDDEGAVKARLVAQQYKHVELDVFAAVATTAAQRVVIARALRRDWTLFPLDISAAFLHAALPEDMRIALRPPQDHGELFCGPDELLVCLKAVYGLQISPRAFQEDLAVRLQSLGFQRCGPDAQLYFGTSSSEFEGVLMSIHVDDFLTTCPRDKKDQLVKRLQEQLKITPGPELRGSAWVKYLGREYRGVHDGLLVRIPLPYLQGILKDLGLQRCRSVATPGVATSSSTRAAPEVNLSAHDCAVYRCVCGKLLWILGERPEVRFAVKEACRAVSKPTQADMIALKRIGRYIAGTMDNVQLLRCDPAEVAGQLIAYTDADYASSRDRKSTSGGIVFYDGVPICSWSRTQPTTATSTTEAEFMGMFSTTSESLLVRSVLQELEMRDIRVVLRGDSSSGLHLALKRGVSKIKHRDVRCLRVQEAIRDGSMTVEYVHTSKNVSDGFTKHLTGARFTQFKRMLGLVRESVDEPQSVQFVS